MSLIARLTSLIRRTSSSPAATTTREVPTPPLPSTALQAFQIERDRHAQRGNRNERDCYADPWLVDRWFERGPDIF